MTYSFSNTPVYVSEGQTVRFKFKAPSQWNTTQSVTIQIGEQQTIWYITTIPEDFAPDPFPFTPLVDADTDVMYVYGDGTRPGEDIITISGLTPTTEASVTLTGSLAAVVDNFSIRVKLVSQGETVFGAWTIPNGNITVTNTDEIQLRLRSNVSQGLTTFADLSVGARVERWTIGTAVSPPNIPEPFPNFTDLTNVQLNTDIYSNILQIQGLNDTAQIVASDTDLYVGISDTNTFFTNSDGYNILSGVTFEQVTGPNYPTINNGQYLQLRLLSENTAGAQSSTALGIGDEPAGSNWSITTGNFPSTTPDNFSFQDKNDVLEDALIGSEPAPLPSGIAGLGTGTEVDVTLVSTDGTEPRIKIQYAEGGESSIGVFPTKVNNGDKIVLYNRSSATFGGSVTTTIRVGGRTIAPWLIVTNNGPDTDADWIAPANLTNQVPSTQVVSSIVSVSGINRPITISATNGALISVDFATPTSSTVTFDPEVNDSFRVFIDTDPNLSGQVTTTVTVGTGTPNQFIWTVSNYAVAPPPPDLKGAWYSKKNALVDSNGDIIENKEDGHSIGTVVPVLKRPDGSYGTLDGSLTSRFPGYLECDGELYDAADYPDLYEVIEETYGGTGVTYDAQNKTYTGQFRVPDLRNRKLVGTGVVDGNRASSAFPPLEGGGSIYDPGETGGWWYVDDVDVAGDNPYEQIIGDVGGTTGTTSNFFSLGTVKTVFDGDITADIDFTITGSVTALIGPLLDTLVSVPPHTHLYITGLVDGVSGDPLIEWRDRGMASLPGSARLDSDGSVGLNAARLNGLNDFSDGVAKSDTQTIVDLWLAALQNYASNFQNEWDDIDGVDDLNTIVTQLISDINTQAYSGGLNGGPGLANVGGDANMRTSQTLVAETWWPSPYSVLSDSYLFTVGTGPSEEYGVDGGSGSRHVTAVIDTNPKTVRVDAYTPPILDGDTGVTESHSHLITLQPVTDLTTDYTYGNVSGWGSAREGLGSAATTVNVTFNQSDVGMELNVGTFTLNTSIKKPIPNVAFSPNRKVELLPEFHKVKYIIKAY